ncbi:hypothetical protein B0H12DRAFT_218682 [Mycena haematopus]|nr:hypothetical protein B0H12DRAFT_218682 [Mycena haematopus]
MTGAYLDSAERLESGHGCDSERSPDCPARLRLALINRAPPLKTTTSEAGSHFLLRALPRFSSLLDFLLSPSLSCTILTHTTRPTDLPRHPALVFRYTLPRSPFNCMYIEDSEGRTLSFVYIYQCPEAASCRIQVEQIPVALCRNRHPCYDTIRYDSIISSL